VITLERYIKIVHSTWHKNHFRPWMIYLACAFSWFGGLVMSMLLVFFTTDVVDGVCMAFSMWESRAAMKRFVNCYFVSFFVVKMFISIFGYARILVVIRHQNQVIHGHHNSGATNTSSLQSQVKIVKTMIIVSAFFAISWFPTSVYYLVGGLADADWNMINTTYYVTLFIAFFNICMNPFIYAAKYDEVKKRLRSWFVCNRVCQQGNMVLITNSLPIQNA
jgi:hypothetical protein